MNTKPTAPPHAARVFSLARLAVIALTVMASPGHAQSQITGPVSRVTDGDTFRLEGLKPAIRVWGLDAPELGTREGTAATRAMASLITGQTLRCTVRDIDRYRRIVGQCFLPDGRDVAALMIERGVATEYCRYSGGYYKTC
ncbi:thermonuclease family protein [Celeribacter marinus]|nr:thermonuclease family protein [Celeribacter marinus]SFK96729.1 Endonuclease YncB, thermonuclease family [Celeribacter marinus]